MRLSLVKKSTNKKTGPIPVSTTSSDSCPSTCPWLGDGCYADGGPLKVHWRALDEKRRGIEFKEFCEEVSNLPEGQLWRHNQAGDLPHRHGRINRSKLAKLILANSDKRGFTYTHHIVEGESASAVSNRSAIALANLNGFVINLSANSIEHADKLVKLSIGPVTTVVPEDQVKNMTTPNGVKVVICPAVTKDNVTCMTCKLCAMPTRSSIVAFPAHGFKKRSMSERLRE